MNGKLFIVIVIALFLITMGLVFVTKGFSLDCRTGLCPDPGPPPPIPTLDWNKIQRDNNLKEKLPVKEYTPPTPPDMRKPSPLSIEEDKKVIYLDLEEGIDVGGIIINPYFTVNPTQRKRY